MTHIAIKTNFINDKMQIPSYAHYNDSGIDLQANIDKPIHISYGGHLLIPTGISIALPQGTPEYQWELQIRPRSGLAYKKGITITNSPGTIDAGYRNEIGVILHNLGTDRFTIEPGDRIAQAVLAKSYRINFHQVDELPEDSRNLNGFGSTGV